MSVTTPLGPDASGVVPVVTHRPTPTGVLPRRAQVWLMMGVAGGILAIILFTGSHDPAAPRAAGASNAGTLPPNPEQLRTYQRRLEAADTRPQTPAPMPTLRPVPPDDRNLTSQATPPQDALADERRRREYESLFASNVVQSPTLPTSEPARGAATSRHAQTETTTDAAIPPSLDDAAKAVLRASAERTGTPPPTAPPSPASAGTASSPAPVAPPAISVADGAVHRVLEGTIIDTILTNRLDGSSAAPVNCLVSTPIYSADDQLLIPAGARVLGTTTPVQSFGETRLAVAFTRLIMPNGRTYPLDQFMGLNAIGDAGLRDQVNQHYASTFGVSAAVGLISGFAQYLGGGLVNRTTGPIVIAGNVGDATAQATSQTMSRLLNRLPTITIREGHRVKVYLTSDLQLPVYQTAPPDRGRRATGRIQP